MPILTRAVRRPENATLADTTSPFVTAAAGHAIHKRGATPRRAPAVVQFSDGGGRDARVTAQSTASRNRAYDRRMPCDDRVPAGRRWKKLAGGLLAAEVALMATPAWAETAMATQSNAAASARLAFKIVIPSIVVIDTRTGVVYSNDARGVPVRSTSGVQVVRREGAPGAGFRPVGRTGTRGIFDGEVFAIP